MDRHKWVYITMSGTTASYTLASGSLWAHHDPQYISAVFSLTDRPALLSLVLLTPLSLTPRLSCWAAGVGCGCGLYMGPQGQPLVGICSSHLIDYSVAPWSSHGARRVTCLECKQVTVRCRQTGRLTARQGSGGHTGRQMGGISPHTLPYILLNVVPFLLTLHWLFDQCNSQFN